MEKKGTYHFTPRCHEGDHFWTVYVDARFEAPDGTLDTIKVEVARTLCAPHKAIARFTSSDLMTTLETSFVNEGYTVQKAPALY